MPFYLDKDSGLPLKTVDNGDGTCSPLFIAEGAVLTSLAVFGQAKLTGDVTLSASGGVELQEMGNNIVIYAPSGGGGGNQAYSEPTFTVGGTTPSAGTTLDVQSATGGIGFPNLDTTQRNALSPANSGVVIYNPDNARLEAYVNGAWTSLQPVYTAVGASGSSELTGSIVLAPSGAVQLTQVGQDIYIYAPTGGGTTLSAPSGAIWFASSAMAPTYDLDRIFIDQVNHCLGLGTPTPSYSLHIEDNTSLINPTLFLGRASDHFGFQFYVNSSGYYYVQANTGYHAVTVMEPQGNVSWCRGSESGTNGTNQFGHSYDETSTNPLMVLWGTGTGYTGDLFQAYDNGGTLDLKIDCNGNFFTKVVNNTAAKTTLTGSAGTAVCSQPEQGASYKKAVIYLSGYTDTGTQTYSFPTAFTHTPYVYGLAGGVSGATATTTTITFTTTLLTGFVFVEGF